MNEQLFKVLQGNPQVQQAIQQAVEGLKDNPGITPETVDQMIKMFEFVLKQPDSYPQLRQQAIQSGQLGEEDLPEQFDESVITVILLALNALKQRMSGQNKPPAFARGGLNQIAAAGRRGDSQLAHINPFEAQVLQSYGGSGTINPTTGLPEFGFFSDLWKGVKSIAKAAIPIATMFVAPYLAPYLGGSMLAAGAVTGGLGAALTGGNVGQGALLGGLGGGLGGMAGSAANNTLGLGLGQTGQSVLGGALMGGVGGELTGQGFLKGAAQGALGQYVGGALGNTGVGGALGKGLTEGGKQFGNMLTAGYDPKTAALGGGLSGLAAGIMKPSETVLNSYKPDAAQLGSGMYDLGATPGTEMVTQGGMNPAPTTGQGANLTYTPPTPTTSMNTPGFTGAGGGFGLNANTAMKALMLSNMLGGSGAPPEAQNAVKSMSPEQQEYFNRPSISWDWGRMQKDAADSNKSLSQFMSENWNQVTGGTYNSPQPVKKLARGGPLTQVANLARGSGSGRADTIDARLSDGEYVFDAESVSMLGDGSTQEGAKRLDNMRAQLRAHKGKALARGKFSPNAKSPLTYLKGAK